MPNQSDPTQNPNQATPPMDQTAGQATTPPVPPIIFPQSDLPPLSPEFQNLPETKPVDNPSGSGGTGSNVPPDISSVTPKAKKKFGGGKIIATILGLVVLVGGVGAGIILTQQQQLFKQKAAVTGGPYCNGICADGSSCRINGCKTAGSAQVEMIRYHCDEICPNGCGPSCRGYGEVERQVTDSMSLKESCGSEQIDAYGTVGGITNGWAHKDYAQDCSGGTPQPTVVPTPSPTPRITPTPTPIPLTCGSECIQANDRCPAPLDCLYLAAPNIFTCQNPTCPGDVDCICSGTPTPTPRITPTPAPLVCNSICTTGITPSSNSGCPAGTTCILDPNSTNPIYRCRNSQCPSDTDCVCAGTPLPTPKPPAPYCVAVTTYKVSPTGVLSTPSVPSVSGSTALWTLIPESDRSKLKAGETIYFCVSGYAANGTFDKARFTINGVLQTETTLRRPGSTDLCQSYTIPTGTRTITVLGEIHDTIYGWFGGISTQ